VNKLRALLQYSPVSFSYADLVRTSSIGAAHRAVERGDAVRLVYDRYVAREHSESFAARAHAAVTWVGPEGALGGTAALFAWGILEDPPQRIHLIARPGTKRVMPSWVRIVRPTYDFPAIPRGGVMAVSPAFAIAQAYGLVAPHERSELVYSAIRRRAVTIVELVEALEVMPRVAKRHALLLTIHAAAAGAESHLEEAGLYDVFNTVEFARLTRQHKLLINSRPYRFDMYDAQTRTSIELDGARFHSSPEHQTHDAQRDAEAAAAGILTVRLSYRDIFDRPDWCRAIVRNTIRARERN